MCMFVLQTGYNIRLLGDGNFLYSFFSTVSKLLETKGWGTRFPYLLRYLCDYGVVKYEDVDKLKKEVLFIKYMLRQYNLTQAVYDYKYPELEIPFGKTEFYDENANLDDGFCVGEEKYGYKPITTIILQSIVDSHWKKTLIELTTFHPHGHREREGLYEKRGREFLKNEYPIMYVSIKGDIDEKIKYFNQPNVTEALFKNYNQRLAKIKQNIPITYSCYVESGVDTYTKDEYEKFETAYKKIIQTDNIKFVYVDKNSPEEDPTIPLSY